MAQLDLIIKPSGTIPELLNDKLFIWIENHDEIDQVMELAELYDIDIYPDSNALHKRREDRNRNHGLLEFSLHHLILISCYKERAEDVIKRERSINPNIITSLDQLEIALHNLNPTINPTVNSTDLTLSEINYLKQLTLIKVKGIKDLFHLVELCNKYKQDIAGNKYRITPELPAMFDVKTDCLDKNLGYLIHVEGLYVEIFSNNVIHVTQESEYLLKYRNRILANHNFIIDNLELLEHLFKKEEEYKKKKINVTGKFKV